MLSGMYSATRTWLTFCGNRRNMGCALIAETLQNAAPAAVPQLLSSRDKSMDLTFHVQSGAHEKPPGNNVMSATDTLPFWKRVARESVWGPRGIVKTGNLWFPLAVIVSTNPDLDLKAAWLPSIILFLAAPCRTIAIILANDLTDRADDIATGKDRWILRVSPFTGIAIVCGLLAFGIGVLALSRAPILSIGA